MIYPVNVTARGRKRTPAAEKKYSIFSAVFYYSRRCILPHSTPQYIKQLGSNVSAELIAGILVVQLA